MSARSISRLRIQAEPSGTGNATTLIDRYLGRQDHATSLRYDLPNRMPGIGDLRLMLVDTTGFPNGTPPLPTGLTTLWHVLWTRDEPSATATITSGHDHGEWPTAPGDSLLVPPGTSLSTAGGQLAIAIATSNAASTTGPLMPPTHGVDQFFGHNRQTTCYEYAGVIASRWKITEPLDLSAHHDEPVVVVALAGDPAIASVTESITLFQGQAARIDASTPATVYPAGLAYLLVISTSPHETNSG